MPHEVTTPATGFSPLIGLLKCLECGAPVEIAEIAARSGYPELGPDGWLECTSCGERYPVIGGTPRMLDREERSRLGSSYPAAAVSVPADSGANHRRPTVQERTAESFAYEWTHFGQPRREWHKNFVDYMQPHEPDFFADKLVLDVGAGSGRHSAQAAELGARVVAIDISESIDVARRNAPTDVLTVQADAERLPFSPGTFDFVMSIGVLHHLPDPRRALKSVAHYARPGGWLHVYLYWQPEVAWHRALLSLVTAARRVTVRMPHRLLHQLCYPLAAALWITIVGPYHRLRKRSRFARLADALPLKTYADYPFAVLVNDQFDRFSAPLERRYTRLEVEMLLTDAGLTDVTVLSNSGWLGDGRVPDTGLPPTP